MRSAATYARSPNQEEKNRQQTAKLFVAAQNHFVLDSSELTEVPGGFNVEGENHLVCAFLKAAASPAPEVMLASISA